MNQKWNETAAKGQFLDRKPFRKIGMKCFEVQNTWKVFENRHLFGSERVLSLRINSIKNAASFYKWCEVTTNKMQQLKTWGIII